MLLASLLMVPPIKMLTFGFGPILNLTKVLTNGEVDGVDNDNIFEGQLATYVINVINTAPAADGNGQCQYSIPANLGQNTGGGGTTWADPTNTEGLPDSNFSVATFASQPQVMEVRDFFSGNYGPIASVRTCSLYPRSNRFGRW